MGFSEHCLNISNDGIRDQETDIMAEDIADVEVKVKFSLNEVISVIQELRPEETQHFIENLLAVTSPEYLKSVKEARADYRAGRISTHDEVFGKGCKK
jgi:hypothetical protein